MKIDITDIRDRDGAAKQFKFLTESCATEVGSELMQISGSVSIIGEVYNDNGRFNVTADISGTAKIHCYRCLKENSSSFSLNMEEIFERDATNADEDSYLYSANTLDITQAVIDSIYLNISDRQLCSSDCKGLCSVCGGNLNEKTCRCTKEEEKESAFSSLKDLFEK